MRVPVDCMGSTQLKSSSPTPYMFHLMSSWLYTTTIISIYLAIVLKIGPSFMKRRPAYKLNTIMTIYNIIQIFLCVFIIKKIWNFAGWNILHLFDCQIYCDDTKDSQTFDSLIVWIYLIKHFELLDTVLFVLRKKQQQVSALHVFHHSSVLAVFTFHTVTFRVRSILFPILLNTCVHVIMYSYYCMAGICSAEFMKRLLFFKKSITTIQMIQFVIILMRLIIFTITCDYSTTTFTTVVIFCIIVVIMFYGFWDFYKKSYMRSTSAN